MTTLMKKKQKPLKVKVTYKQIPETEESRQKVDRAFDILFDEVLKRRQEQKR